MNDAEATMTKRTTRLSTLEAQLLAMDAAAQDSDAAWKYAKTTADAARVRAVIEPTEANIAQAKKAQEAFGVVSDEIAMRSEHRADLESAIRSLSTDIEKAKTEAFKLRVEKEKAVVASRLAAAREPLREILSDIVVELALTGGRIAVQHLDTDLERVIGGRLQPLIDSACKRADDVRAGRVVA